MSLPEKNIEQIEAYLAHSMDANERTAFEAELQSNNVMREELENRQQAHLMLDVLIADNLREEMRAFESEAKVVTLKKRKKNRYYSLAIAASVAVLVGAFAIFGPFGKNAGSNPMAFYELPTATLRGGGSSLPEGLANGLEAFDNKNYGLAVEQLQSIDSNNPYYIDAQYYLGHAAFNAKKYAVAAEAFTSAAASGDSRYAQNSDWFGLLNCLAQDISCDQYFEKILNTGGHSYQAKTQQLKNQLK